MIGNQNCSKTRVHSYCNHEIDGHRCVAGLDSHKIHLLHSWTLYSLRHGFHAVLTHFEIDPSPQFWRLTNLCPELADHDSCFQVWWRKKGEDVAQYLIWKKNIDVRIVHVVSSLLLLSMPFQSQLLNFVDGSMTSLITFTEHKKLDCKFQTVNLSNSKREQITSFKIILVSSTFFLVIDATCLRTPMPLKANMPILTP